MNFFSELFKMLVKFCTDKRITIRTTRLINCLRRYTQIFGGIWVYRRWALRIDCSPVPRGPIWVEAGTAGGRLGAGRGSAFKLHQKIPHMKNSEGRSAWVRFHIHLKNEAGCSGNWIWFYFQKLFSPTTKYISCPRSLLIQSSKHRQQNVPCSRHHRFHRRW